MRNVHLHGHLGKKFGREFRFEIDTVVEAVRALSVNLPGFREEISRHEYHIVRGKTPEAGLELDLELCETFRLGKADLHFVPHIAGGKNRGLVKTILGVALIGLSFGSAAFLAKPISAALLGPTTWGNAFGTIGLGLTLNGASSLLSGQKKKPKDDKSYLFSGPGATQGQGGPVPLVYGKVITQGVLVSGGIDVERL